MQRRLEAEVVGLGGLASVEPDRPRNVAAFESSAEDGVVGKERSAEIHRRCSPG